MDFFKELIKSLKKLLLKINFISVNYMTLMVQIIHCKLLKKTNAL